MKKSISLIVLMLGFISLIFAQEKNNMLYKKVKLSQKTNTIKQFLKEIQKNEGVNISYNENIIPEKKVTINNDNVTLKEALDKLFTGTNFKYKVLSKQIVIYKEIKENNKKKATINGRVKSSENGEYLLGASVYIEELKTGMYTNAYGFYSITVPPGNYTFRFSFIGFTTHSQFVSLNKNKTINIELKPHVSELNEITIESKNETENITGIEMSSHEISIQKVKSIPVLAGESDILKSLQFLPGIQPAAEGTTGFSVRGGSFDQNLILLDEAPVYNPSHSMGLFSIFNPDAIKDIKVYKGGIPAKYGGRLSSVIDMRMKEGNDKKFSVNGNVGVVGSRLTVEGPIGKNISYLVSGRYGYIGYTAKKLAKWTSIENFRQDTEISFYDLNAKVNIKLGEKDRIYFSTYTGDDHFFNNVIFEDNTFDWGNLTGTFRWNHVFSPKLFANLTLVTSNFDYQYIINNDVRNFEWSANFKQKSAKIDFDFFASTKSTFVFGASVTEHDFSPGIIKPRNGDSLIEPFQLDEKNAIEAAAYISHELQLSNRLSLDYGIRVTSFLNIGEGQRYLYENENLIETENYEKGEVMDQFNGFAPRFSMRYILNENSSLKASYNRTYQFLHLVSNSTVGLPTDVWLPVDNNIKPRTADQISIGYFKNFKNNNYKMSVESFYKKFDNVIDYKDNADLFLNNNIETQIRTGDGEAYGLELLVEKTSGKLTGWLSYTLSKVEHQIDGVNYGKIYSPGYDKRHNFSLVTSYRINDKWEIASNYSYITGRGITIPLGFYNTVNRPYNYYSERNAHKLPAFHQLDISAKIKSVKDKRWQSEFTFGVTNAYNRHNFFSFYVNHQENARSQVFKMYLFGLMPAVTYNFKF